jgi:hypothetical protein
MLYSLDRLYKAVEWHAKETGEWIRLKISILFVPSNWKPSKTST